MANREKCAATLEATNANRQQHSAKRQKHAQDTRRSSRKDDHDDDDTEDASPSRPHRVHDDDPCPICGPDKPQHTWGRCWENASNLNSPKVKRLKEGKVWHDKKPKNRSTATTRTTEHDLVEEDDMESGVMELNPSDEAA
jgi:hypothetical protein